MRMEGTDWTARMGYRDSKESGDPQESGDPEVSGDPRGSGDPEVRGDPRGSRELKGSRAPRGRADLEAIGGRAVPAAYRVNEDRQGGGARPSDRRARGAHP